MSNVVDRVAKAANAEIAEWEETVRRASDAFDTVVSQRIVTELIRIRFEMMAMRKMLEESEGPAEDGTF
jgi:hypothetical protein